MLLAIELRNFLLTDLLFAQQDYEYSEHRNYDHPKNIFKSLLNVQKTSLNDFLIQFDVTFQ